MQCLHLGVLTWILTDWACPWPSRPSSGGIPTGIRMENTAKSTCFITFLQSELKKPWKTFDFRTFSKKYWKNIGFMNVFIWAQNNMKPNCFSTCSAKYCKNTGFMICFAIWGQKIMKIMCFSICSAKHCKTRRFYKVLEHSGCKNKGKPKRFQYVHQDVAKSTDFIRLPNKGKPMFSLICSAKYCKKHSIAKIAQ